MTASECMCYKIEARYPPIAPDRTAYQQISTSTSLQHYIPTINQHLSTTYIHHPLDDIATKQRKEQIPFTTNRYQRHFLKPTRAARMLETRKSTVLCFFWPE